MPASSSEPSQVLLMDSNKFMRDNVNTVTGGFGASSFGMSNGRKDRGN